MVGIESLLEPGETVIKDSGRLPCSYQKSLVEGYSGRLCLTNRNLIFAATTGWDLKRGTVRIPLHTIVKVEKGFMATIKVQADKKYTFRGMTKASEWVSAIDQAKSMIGAHVTPPVQPTPMQAFCPKCGRPVRPEDQFCGKCGATLS